MSPSLRLSKCRPWIFRPTLLAARVLLLPFFRIRTEGLSRLPERGPFLLFPKHQRWEDVPLLSMAVKRPLFYVAKHQLFQTAFSRWWISSLGGLPLNRDRPMESRDSIRAIWALLAKGEKIVIFPEGTYFPGRMGPGRSGLTRMILGRADAPCIPVGIRYQPGRFRKEVRVSFGEAVPARPGESAEAIFERIMPEIARLSGLPPGNDRC